MKILMINSVCGIKSTGRICTDLASALEQRGHQVMIAYGRGEVPAQYTGISYRIGTDLDVAVHGCLARVFDASGHGSRIATEKFLDWVRRFDPDVIHLHNIHGYYIHVPLLFDYLKRSGKRVIWTLHDCWPFTGHCCYFDYAGCGKWRTQCSACPQRGEYPASLLLDRSKENFIAKKRLFSGLPEMTLVTPSRWLAALASQSFMGAYPIHTIPNWVDLQSFSPTPGDVRRRYSIDRKYMILGTASVWTERKGLDTFLQLEKRLGENYQIVLVGVSERQRMALPKTILGIRHTSSVHELAELYSAADVFVNPTREDNYPTTNLEAIACGTPVVTFDVGGSGENAALYGTAVPENDLEYLTQAIRSIAEGRLRFTKPNLNAYNTEAFGTYLCLLEGRGETALYAGR